MLGIAAVLAAPAAAQTSRIEGGSTALSGFVFHYETRLDPPVPPLGDSLNMLVLTTPPSTVHRVMLDRTKKVYFGYDAVIGMGGRVTAGQAERLYQITFAALTSTPALEKILGVDASEWKRLPAPEFPGTREIREGEVLELALLNNNTWGQRMTEYVTILPPQRQGFDRGPKWEFVFAPGAPRDFTTTDVVLRFVEPHVRAALRASSDAAARVTASRTMFRVAGDVAGPVAWIYVPTRGRFLLSLVPRSEFRLAGSVRGTSLNFTVDGDSYAVTSASPIAPGEAAFNLYVRHQPAWTPSYPNADVDAIHMGAADRLEYLNPSR